MVKRNRNDPPPVEGAVPAGEDTNVIAKFVSEGKDFETAELSLPLGVSREALDTVLSTTLGEQEPATYAFFVNNVEVTESLMGTLLSIHRTKVVEQWQTSGRRFTKKDVSNLTLDSSAVAEETVVISFRPQAIFKVRPVSRCISALHGHTEPILVVAFNPDSSLLATGSGDRTIRIWDLHTETPQATLRGHNDWVQVLSWSPCGTLLASGAKDGSVCLWDAAAPHALIARPSGNAHSRWVTCLAWEPWMSYSLDETVEATAPRPAAVDAAVDADAAADAAAADAPAVLLGADGEPVKRRTPHSGKKEITANVGRGCLRFVSGGKDGVLRVWRLSGARLTPEATLPGHTQAITCVRWGATGKIYSGSEDRSLRVFDPRGVLPPRILAGHGHWINSLALNTDAVIRSGAYDHTPAAAALEDPVGPEGRALAHDRLKKLLVALSAVTKSPPESAERAVTASDDNTLFLWNPLASDKPLARLVGHQGAVYSASFSPDGMLVASAAADNSVRLWHGVTGRFISSHRGHVGAVYAVAWSLDARMFVSGSRDSTLKLWGVQQKEHVSDLPGHADQVYALDWSPDGLRVASGSKDRTVRIWRH